MELLRQWGVTADTLLPGPEEDSEALEVVMPGESPRHYVQRVTDLKLGAALTRVKARGLPLAPVLCADTTVALGRDILGKPDSPEHARAILSRLAGVRHRVLTAVALGKPGEGPEVAPVWRSVSESWVTFAPMSTRDIAAYVETGEPMGKAGAYGIQGLAALWISHISGSYSGIMGLPAFETAQVLRQAGIAVPVV